MISIFQIYFDELSRQKLDPDFIPYKNEIKDDFFENSVIRKLYEMSKQTHYIGVTSWKMNSKTNITGIELKEYIENDIKSVNEKDVYIYCPVNNIETKYDFSCSPPLLRGIIKECDIWAGHKRKPEAFEIDQDLNTAGILPFDLFDGKWQYCYNNFWVAKWNVFYEYCKNVLIPSMDFIASKNYPKTYRHSSGKLYTHACFTLEALFGAFLAHRNYTFDYICKKKVQKKFKMIKIDCYEITN